jgi:predicted RNA-binding protein associated with RNAse of E/G family
MILVRKRNENGQVTWEYVGEELLRGENFVKLEARFNRDDLPFQGIVLKRDDRFVETYYTDRWYNIFEIHDRDDDSLKGWYCNIGRPAVWDAYDTISYIDLELDLWVTPAGEQSVLDEEEFERANLDAPTHAQALQALAELQQLFKSKQPDLSSGLS